ESSKMISVYVRPKRNSSVSHFAKPVKFAVECKVLKNSKPGNQKSKQHREPEKTSPVLQRAERLRCKKNHHNVGNQKLDLHARRKRRSGHAKNPLRGCHSAKRKQRHQNRRKHKLFFFVQGKKNGPQKKQHSSACFKYRDRPIFHTAVRRNSKH